MQKNFVASLLGVTIALVGCGGGNEETVAGEITDDAISLSADSAGPTVWIELRNAGDTPCDLLAVMSEAPDELPMSEGRVAFPQSGAGVHRYVEEMYVEVDGEAAGSAGTPGEAVTIEPTETGRLQIAFKGVPEREERVILCNGEGDYERGRYAVLPFTR